MPSARQKAVIPGIAATNWAAPERGSSRPVLRGRGQRRRDVAAILADLADDAEWSWPGSGEVIRGRPAIRRSSAGPRPAPRPRPSDHRRAGPRRPRCGPADYGDGVPWRNISLFEFRAGRIVAKTDGFGSAFEPPAWRRELVSVEPLPKP